MSPQPTKSSPSTGPRTAAGKASSSQNSLRHGLASGKLLIPGEDPAEFDSLLHGLLEDWEPDSTTERILVENMAKHQWLVDRAIRLQGEALTASPDPTNLPPSFALLLRYQATNERAFCRAQKALEDSRRARREFVSQTDQAAAKSRQAAALAFINRPFPAPDYAKMMETLQKNREAAPVPPASAEKVKKTAAKSAA